MLVATESAVYHLDETKDRVQATARFQGHGVRCVAEGTANLVAALSDGTIQLLRRGGSHEVFSGIDQPIACLLILREDPLELLIGTEGAHLFDLRGHELSRIGGFDALDCRPTWHTPWGGPPSVRSLAATPDGCVYADIHVGSIMRSSDGGRTWEPVRPELNEDVHQVVTCPACPDRVYANTARGVYISDDRGESWAHRAEDLGCRYGRAIAVAPNDPDLLLATVSDGPHGENVHAQLWRSEDCGKSWQHVSSGFPASTAENIDTYHVAFSARGLGWALAGKTLYVGDDRAMTWRPFWQAPEAPLMLAVVSPVAKRTCPRGSPP